MKKVEEEEEIQTFLIRKKELICLLFINEEKVEIRRNLKIIVRSEERKKK